MIVGIHQPNFLPWIGYFYKMMKTDVFVILDDVQYTKNSFINRNKIKTPNGTQWLTVPVNTSGKFGQNINETTIFSQSKSFRKILSSIRMSYSKSKYFDLYYNDFEQVFIGGNNDSLSNLNIKLIQFLKEKLNIETKLVVSSTLDNIKEGATERLISICKKVECDKYFSGFGGKNYQDLEMFKNSNISLISTDFKHPNYKQLWGDFIPNLSTIDLLFNYGPESNKYLDKGDNNL